MLNNIYAIDIDREALNITRLKALSYLGNTTREKITVLNKKIILKNGLIRNNLLNRQEMALDVVILMVWFGLVLILLFQILLTWYSKLIKTKRG